MNIQVIIIASLLAVALVGGAVYWVYSEGQEAGSSSVTTETQRKTIEALDAAAKAKEKADADVRNKPFGERVDGLR